MLSPMAAGQQGLNPMMTGQFDLRMSMMGMPMMPMMGMGMGMGMGPMNPKYDDWAEWNESWDGRYGRSDG